MEERIGEIGKMDLPLKEKISLLAHDLKDYFHTDIYFCEIMGKRWSFVAGSGNIINGIHRLKLTNHWGIIADIDLTQNSDISLIINLIRKILTD
jgi:ethanolamine utilization protein EutP (predicted NTPase)